jgi:hypothetical protein
VGSNIDHILTNAKNIKELSDHALVMAKDLSTTLSALSVSMECIEALERRVRLLESEATGSAWSFMEALNRRVGRG